MSQKFCPNHPTNKVWTKGVCIYCYRMKYAKKLSKSPIAPLSEKQKNILAIYRLLRRKYLANNRICMIGLEGCTTESTEIHHTAKKYSRKDWLDTSKYLATCRSCHQKVENSPTLAKQLGIYNYKTTNEKDIKEYLNNDLTITDLEFYDAVKRFNNIEKGSVY